MARVAAASPAKMSAASTPVTCRLTVNAALAASSRSAPWRAGRCRLAATALASELDRPSIRLR